MQQRLSLNRYLFTSVATHGLLLLLLLVIVPRIDLPIQEPISVVMIELPIGKSEEVGLGIPETRALPTVPIAETVTPPATPPPTGEPPMPEPPVVRKEVKVPQPKPPTELSPADRKIRDALKRVNDQLHTRKTLPEVAQTTNPSEGYKYGTTNKPLPALPPDVERSRYISQVKARIQREWIHPPAQGSPDLRLSVRIDPSGRITTANLTSHSGDGLLDASLMRAVHRASPLPAPPESVRQEALTKGFVLGFK